MFAKLSALALCLSFVSALECSVPLTVKLGASVDIDVITTRGDPVDIGLVLIGPNADVDVDLEHDVAVTATIDVDIPLTGIPEGPGYLIAAIEVGNPTVVYAKSNLFEIESA